VVEKVLAPATILAAVILGSLEMVGVMTVVAAMIPVVATVGDLTVVVVVIKRPSYLDAVG
jgi:hypothetical protein